MKEITFSKRNAFLILLIILISGAGILLLQQFSPQQVAGIPTPSVDEIGASSAAVAGTRAFFQVDSQAGMDTWLERFCSLSTQNGCALVRMGAGRLWQMYAQEQLSIQATVFAVAQISSTPGEQVWQMAVELSAPLPGSNKTQDEAYVLVVKEGDAWKFDRFLLEPEVQALQERELQEDRQ